MATATFSVVGPNVGNHSRSFGFSDIDAGRVIAAWGAKLGRSDPQAIVDGIADAFLAHVLAEAHEHDKRVAAQAASDAVTEIVATPLPTSNSAPPSG